MEISAPEREAIAKAVDLLETAAHRALRTANGPQIHNALGRHEATVEAILLHVLVVRHTEAVCAVARGGLECLASAQVLARASFEAALRCLWMMAPDDPMDRECRWLALLHEWELDVRQMRQQGGTPQGPATEQLTKFRRRIEDLLEARGYKKPRSGRSPVPTVRWMLSDLSREAEYVAYVRLSKQLHGTLEATALYRNGLGDAKELVEAIGALEWRRELRLVWHNLDVMTTRILAVLVELGVLPAGGQGYLDADFRAALQRALADPTPAPDSLRRRALRPRSLRTLTGDDGSGGDGHAARASETNSARGRRRP